MADVSVRSKAQGTAGRSEFEVDRFELVAGERYEVEGRWSGVRGRVFIRPELILTDGDRTERLLADLAQKPWQAAEGTAWSVAFPCPDAPIDATRIELAVAPDISVAIKSGRGTRRRANKGSTARKPAAQVAPPARSKTGADRKPRGLGVQLAEAQSELQRLHDEKARLAERLDATERRAEAARAERDRVARGGEQLASDRDDAVRARDEALSARAAAIRDTALAREEAERGRDEALAELVRTRDELERSLETLKTTASERDDAIRAGVEVERELRAASSARDALLADREQLSSHQDQPPGPDFVWERAGSGRTSLDPSSHSRVAALVALSAAVILIALVLILLVF